MNETLIAKICRHRSVVLDTIVLRHPHKRLPVLDFIAFIQFAGDICRDPRYFWISEQFGDGELFEMCNLKFKDLKPIKI